MGLHYAWKKNINLTMIEYLRMHASMILFDVDQKNAADYVMKRYPCQELKLEQRVFGLAYCSI